MEKKIGYCFFVLMFVFDACVRVVCDACDACVRVVCVCKVVSN